jgi:hypothetical protein
MADRFKRVVRSSGLWAALYLLLVPLFAWIYYAQEPGSFHDTNLRHEAAVAHDAAELQTSLTAALKARLSERRWSTSGYPVTINPASVAVTGIGYRSEGRVLLEVTGTYGTSAKQEPKAFGTFIRFVTLIPSDYLGLGLRGKNLKFGLPVTSTDKSGRPERKPPSVWVGPPVGLLFPPLGPHRFSSQAGMLLMPVATYERLRRFDIAGTGDPSYASGSFLRMIYLSAVTVTTLGFGDITPVSEDARLYVALEAVLGVIFVGIFLSRLAIREREPTGK